MKKILEKISIIFISIMLIAVISNASYEDVIMSVVKEPVATIKFGENSYIERKVVSKDLAKKEITIQLKVTNEEKAIKPSGELMLIIDNSLSMTEKANGDTKTREELVINSAKSLIKTLLTDNETLKIGAVSFSTSSEQKKEATTEDAKLVSELTDNQDELLKKIDNIKYDGPRTDLESGIELAKKYFTKENTNKYIIVLTDGVPNVSLGENLPYYSDAVIENTKKSLKSLSTIVGENVYIMLTGIDNGDLYPYDGTSAGQYETYKDKITKRTFNEIINEIFGTGTNPTIGKFYYITDKDIEETITKKIYSDLLGKAYTFKNIKVTDYFSKEIVENFDFSYVLRPTIGTISDKIEVPSNSITWQIPELEAGTTVITQYKLKLKENYSPEILDKILDTNPKLDITYDNKEGKSETKTTDVTPQIKLQEPKKEENIAPIPIPKAGNKNSVVFAVTLGVALVGVFYIKYNKYKDI